MNQQTTQYVLDRGINMQQQSQTLTI